MKKKEFPRNTVELNLKDDFPLNQDITVAFWVDPSRQVISDLFRIVGMSTENMDALPEGEKEALDDRYFECVSLVFVDCDIDGIDFGTPESAREAFDDERLPWGVFHQAMLLYMERLTEEYAALKNALRRAKRLSNSGETKETKDNE
jgi:hypothetical protein